MKKIYDVEFRNQLNAQLKKKFPNQEAEHERLLPIINVEETLLTSVYDINVSDSLNHENKSYHKRGRLISFYQNFIYRLTRDDGIQRALLYLFMSDSNLQKQTDNATSRLKRYWPSHTSARLNHPEIPFLLTKAVTGARLITDNAWPLTLLGLLSYDLHRYQNEPEQRYGNTLHGLWLGGLWPGSNLNLSTLSRHLGSGVIHDGWSYWLGISLAMVTPLLAGLTYSLIHSYRFNVPQITKLQATVDYLAKLEPSFWSNTLAWLWPFSGTAYQVLAAERALLWRNKIASKTQKDLLAGMQDLAQRHGGLTQLAAIRSLAKLTDHKQPIDENPPHTHGSICSPLSMLQMIAEDRDRRHLVRYYAHYQLWTLGESNNPWVHLWWLPPTLAWSGYVLYAKLRLGETLVQKMVTAIQTLHEAHLCHTSGKVWAYQPERADYVCGVCPDWNFVPQSQINHSQGCVDGLLATERDSHDLLRLMDRVLKPPFFTDLDLSQQSWTSWPVNDWQTLLAKLANSSLPKLQVINLSQPALRPPQVDKLQLLNRFLQQTPVQHLDLSRQHLGAQQLQSLLQELPPTVKQLNLADNLLGDEGAAVLSKYLPGLSLESINLSRNNIGDNGIAELAMAFSQTGLTKLDLSANQFGALGLSYLTECMPNTVLTELNLSYNDLSLANLQEWGAAVANSSLIRLALRQTQLYAEQLEAWAPQLGISGLQKLDLAYNPFSDEGLKHLLMASCHNDLSELDLSYSDITDNGVAQLERYLIDTRWTHLSLSGNQLGLNGLLSLAQGLNGSELEHLTLANMELGDVAVLAFAEVLNATSHRLSGLNLAHNQLSGGAALALLASLPTQLTRLELQHNRLDDAFATYLADSLSQRKSLTYLDLSHNVIGARGTEWLGKKLDDATGLTRLRLAQNPIGATGGKSLASFLISRGPFSIELGKLSLSQDARRAIAKTRTQTTLTELDLTGCELDDSAALALCRVQPYTHIPFAALGLAENSLKLIDAGNCRSRSNLQRSGFFKPAPSTQRLAQSQTQINQTDWPLGFILGSLSLLGGIVALVYLMYRVANRYAARSSNLASPIIQAEELEFERPSRLF
ncbi:MAG: RNI-like protein [Gammaproteobacteria bacterium]|nr:RNI-like protein [Gammaproteobacteria bacterium]